MLGVAAPSKKPHPRQGRLHCRGALLLASAAAAGLALLGLFLSQGGAPASLNAASWRPLHAYVPHNRSVDAAAAEAGVRRGGVPRIIHQSWKTHNPPEWFKRTASTFQAANPGFQFVLWDDDANEALMRDHYPWFRSTWESFPRTIYRADAARAMYMHRNGGLYFDFDFFCLRPLEQAAAQMTGVVLGYMADDHDFDNGVPNAFMASDPGQPFWLHYLQRVQRVAQGAAGGLDKNGWGPEYVTGPAGLREALLEWWEECAGQGLPHNVTVMDRKVWYLLDWHLPASDGSQWWEEPTLPLRPCTPKHFDLDACAAANPGTLTLTHWTHSWEQMPWDRQRALDLSGGGGGQPVGDELSRNAGRHEAGGQRQQQQQQQEIRRGGGGDGGGDGGGRRL